MVIGYSFWSSTVRKTTVLGILSLAFFRVCIPRRLEFPLRFVSLLSYPFHLSRLWYFLDKQSKYFGKLWG